MKKIFPKGVRISREISTGGVLISQEISTRGVLVFGEYLFSVTGVKMSLTVINTFLKQEDENIRKRLQRIQSIPSKCQQQVKLK